MRLVLPDARKSIERYLANDDSFELFQRRKQRAKRHGIDYTLWECMRECFVSRSCQQGVLGENTLAHQNAWDFDTINADLKRAGFATVEKSGFQMSSTREFDFEGTFHSEANEAFRSLYVEAQR